MRAHFKVKFLFLYGCMGRWREVGDVPEGADFEQYLEKFVSCG